MTQGKHLGLLRHAQLIGRFGTHGGGTTIEVDRRAGSPALVGTHVNPDLDTRPAPARARAVGLRDQRHGLLAIGGTDHSASPSPQIAWTFFRSTRSAAVSANAFSLRRSSLANA